MPPGRQQRPQTPTPAQVRREALYAALAQIPSGRVISYGELARLAGLGRAARWVGQMLGRLPEGTQLPWHRVIGAGGRLSLPPDSPAGLEQRARLRAEGVYLEGSRVDLRRYGWHPGASCG